MKHAAALAALALVSGTFSFVPPPPDPVGDVLIEGPSVLAPGSRAALRVAAFESTGLGDTHPAAGVEIVVAFNGAEVFRGATDDRGGADVAFLVPDLKDGDYELSVAAGAIAHKQNIRVHKAIKILLVSDKPLYQPGQIIHLRALALADLSLQAAGGVPVRFEIEDAKGNKVFKQEVTASEFGVAATDFQLADEVNMGDFHVAASIGEFKAEKNVTVQNYVLPKFKVELKGDRSFYKPLDTVKGSIQADYFFGKPVAEGDVEVIASTFDFEFKEFARLKLKTDAKGHADFELALPDYFVGSALEQGNASVRIEASVTDAADHAQKGSKSFAVAEQPLRIYAVAESGRIVPGVENVLYVLTSDPNGASLKSALTVKAAGATIALDTNDLGYAEIRLTPKEEHLAQRNGLVLPVEVTAATKDGARATKTLDLSTESAGDAILLRLDKAVYAAGDRLTMDVFGSFGQGDVYIDVVKRGQTLLTTTVPMADGRARYEMVAPAEAFGSIEVHAYTISKYGDIIRDTRVAYVQPASDLAVKISTDRRQYRPGDLAKIEFHVTDASGQGVAAALGVIVVDESVYALQEMQPGLEKVYFMLEQELAAPKIEFCPGGATVSNLVGLRDVEEAQQDVGKMLFAGAEPASRRWTKNTLAERKAQLIQQLNELYWPIYSVLSQGAQEITYREGGKRRFTKDALAKVAEKGGIQKRALKDPWGRDLTIDVLEALDARFRIEAWKQQFNSQFYWTYFQALSQRAIANDIVVRRDGAWAYADGLDAVVGAQKDIFGDEVTIGVLAETYPVFKADELAKLTREQRLATLFNEVVSGVKNDTLKRADENGVAFDLDALGKAEPAFSKPNLDKITNGQREYALIERLQALIASDGVSAVAEGGAYRADLIDRLVKGTVLIPQYADGSKITIAALTASVPGASLDNMVKLATSARIWAVYNALSNYGNAHLDRYYDRNTNEFDFPEGIVNLLIIDKQIERETLRDPWGGSIRVRRVEKKLDNRVYWNMPWNVVEAAGPDGAFGTKDDLDAIAAMNVAGYGPNYRDAVWYQGTLINTWWGWENDHNEALGEAGGAGGRWGGRKGDMPPAADAMAPMELAMRQGAPMQKDGGMQQGQAAPPRIREYFPETLLWAPNVITDAQGRATIDLAMADSITTWRLTASASSARGQLGSATDGITVFQDFFVDLDLPVALTQNDRVSIPVAVYNYLKERQTIKLTLEADDWYELDGDAVKSITADPDQVQVVYFPIRVVKIGSHRLTVTATGSSMSDAIRREIDVNPDGQRVEEVLNGSLTQDLTVDLTIPQTAIDDASKILVKFYPGVFSQLVDGLDGMLSMPGG